MILRFVIVLLLGLLSLSVSAQEEGEMTVSGSVLDADLKEPMVQATVQLFRSKDSTFVGGTVTDLRGTFSVEAPANGIYRLKVSSVGYQAIELRLPMGFEITSNLHENSRRGYNDPSSNTNELIWNGQISKTFLKSKSLVIALNFYDLLGQQSNYERWVNANGRSDTRYNSINSYAMLHVRYRLNMFGGKIDTEGRYDKKWGNRDQRGR